MATLYGLMKPVQTAPRVAKPRKLGPPQGGRLGGGLQPSQRAAAGLLSQQYGSTPTATLNAAASYTAPKKKTASNTSTPLATMTGTPLTQSTLDTSGMPAWASAAPPPAPPAPSVNPQTAPPAPTVVKDDPATVARIKAEREQQDRINAIFQADPRFIALHANTVKRQNELMAYYGFVQDANGNWVQDNAATNPYSVSATLGTQLQQGIANTQNQANAAGVLFSGANAAGVMRSQDAYNRNLVDTRNSFQTQTGALQQAENDLYNQIYADLVKQASSYGESPNPTPGTTPTPGGTAENRLHNMSRSEFLNIQNLSASHPQQALKAIYAYLAQWNGGKNLKPEDLKILQNEAARLRAIITAGRKK